MDKEELRALIGPGILDIGAETSYPKENLSCLFTRDDWQTWEEIDDRSKKRLQYQCGVCQEYFRFKYQCERHLLKDHKLKRAHIQTMINRIQRIEESS